MRPKYLLQNNKKFTNNMDNEKIKNNPQKQIREVAKKVTKTRESACMFLKSAGIMTSKGNLSPNYQ